MVGLINSLKKFRRNNMEANKLAKSIGISLFNHLNRLLINVKT
jgi:hypothetical protein